MAIRNDTAIYILGQITSKVVPFLMLPYLTRVLGVEKFGMLSYWLAIGALLMIFFNLSQDGSFSRYYFKYGKNGLWLVSAIGFIYSLIVYFIVLIVALSTNSIGTGVIATYCFFSVQMSVQLVNLQCRKKAINYFIINLLQGVGSSIFTIVVFSIFSVEYEFRIIALALVAMMLALYCFFSYKNIKPKNITAKKIKVIVKFMLLFGGPLIFHHLSFFSKGQLERIYIKDVFSSAELGIYSAAFQLASILFILLLSINQAVMPYYYEGLKNKKLNSRVIMKYFKLSFIIFIVPISAQTFISDNVYKIILGDSFGEVKHSVDIFLYGITLNCQYFLLVNYLFYHGKTMVISACNILSAAVYILFLFYIAKGEISNMPYALLVSNIVLVFFILVQFNLTSKELEKY